MILSKKQLFDLEVKGQCPTKVIMVRDTPPYGHAPMYQILLTYLERQKSYGPDKLRWEEAEEEEADAEEKIRLKQYVSPSNGLFRKKMYERLECTLYSQTCNRSSPFWTKKKWPYKTGDLLKEMQCIWNFQ